MASRDGSWWRDGGSQNASTPKRRRTHEVSDSEYDYNSDGDSMVDHFADPRKFMKNFGGYASDEDQESSDEKGMSS
jgi:hypothetical protein